MKVDRVRWDISPLLKRSLHTHILNQEPPEEGSVLSASGTLHMASQLNHLLP